jgi:putative transposase
VERCHGKLEGKALEKDVEENPEAKLIDRNKKFGVRPSAIYYALKKMKINNKKARLSGKEPRRKNKVLQNIKVINQTPCYSGYSLHR